MELRIGIVGEILEGVEAGRFVEVLDEGENTGGYLIMTYGGRDRTPETFDVWMSSLDEARLYFEDCEWVVKWPPPYPQDPGQ